MDNVFARAANNLPGHWFKGGYADGAGNFCALGHIALARGFDANRLYDFDEDDVFDTSETELLNSLAREMSNGDYQYIADFNDADDTTEADVVTLLEKAAVRIEENV